MQCEGWVGQRKGRVKLWQGRGKARQFQKKKEKKYSIFNIVLMMTKLDNDNNSG